MRKLICALGLLTAAVGVYVWADGNGEELAAKTAIKANMAAAKSIGTTWDVLNVVRRMQAQKVARLLAVAGKVKLKGRGSLVMAQSLDAIQGAMKQQDADGATFLKEAQQYTAAMKDAVTLLAKGNAYASLSRSADAKESLDRMAELMRKVTTASEDVKEALGLIQATVGGG